jgi:CheY-like chemotaxis protein
VTTADEALAVARGREVALVISDYSMPGSKSGLELLEELRVEQPVVPFVLASVQFPDGVPDRARRAGAQLVVDKSDLLRDPAGLVRGLVGAAA